MVQTGERIVAAEQTVSFAGLPPVLATPFVIWILEETAMELLEPFLEEDDLTLGTQVDIEHLGMARVGETVSLQAQVVRVDGRDYLFHVEARSRDQVLAKGLHRRRLVSRSRLLKKLAANSE